MQVIITGMQYTSNEVVGLQLCLSLLGHWVWWLPDVWPLVGPWTV